MLAQPPLSAGLTLYANGCFRVTPPPPCTFNSHYRCQKITNVCFLRVGKTVDSLLEPRPRRSDISHSEPIKVLTKSVNNGNNTRHLFLQHECIIRHHLKWIILYRLVRMEVDLTQFGCTGIKRRTYHLGG